MLTRIVSGAIILLFLSFLSPVTLRAESSQIAFDELRASFEVSLKEISIPYQVFAVSALPGEKLSIEARSVEKGAMFSIAGAGKVVDSKQNSWTWQAPNEVGLYGVVIKALETADSIRLNVFVIEPFKKVKNGYLNGYRIGTYPNKSLRDLPIYKPPRGFIEVTEEMLDVAVAPHFKLRQFLCKQESGFPKYIVLRELLLLKLEMLLQLTNSHGYRCSTFYVMSGFRTPYYNHSIGNVKYSRHCWGGAADIFIDESPRDGVMDDLNSDGAINWKDAAALYEIVDDLYGSEHYKPYVGGLGRYKKTKSHGPFIHVDVRGFRARWGD